MALFPDIDNVRDYTGRRMWLRRPGRTSRASRLRYHFHLLSRLYSSFEYEYVAPMPKSPQLVTYSSDSDDSVLHDIPSLSIRSYRMHTLCTTPDLSNDYHLSILLSNFSVSECYYFNCNCDCDHPLNSQSMPRLLPRVTLSFSWSHWIDSLMSCAPLPYPRPVPACVCCMSTDCEVALVSSCNTLTFTSHTCGCSLCNHIENGDIINTCQLSDHCPLPSRSIVYGCRRFITHNSASISFRKTLGLYYYDKWQLDRLWDSFSTQLENDLHLGLAHITNGANSCPCHSCILVSNSAENVSRCLMSIWIFDSQIGDSYSDSVPMYFCSSAAMSLVYFTYGNDLFESLLRLRSEVRHFDDQWYGLIDYLLSQCQPPSSR